MDDVDEGEEGHSGLDDLNRAYATGRRKTSIARGKGMHQGAPNWEPHVSSIMIIRAVHTKQPSPLLCIFTHITHICVPLSIFLVWIKEGDGRFIINDREIHEYFGRVAYREKLVEPFVVTGTAGKFDVWCTVKGGGTTGNKRLLVVVTATAALL